jgi:trans-aconitate methyltransferase
MPPKYRIQIENSAPSQGKPARSVCWATSILKAEGVTSVVDLGCGRLRNLRTLQDHFDDITLVDTKLQCIRVANGGANLSSARLMTIDEFKAEDRTYDAIFLISVLHVLDKISIRKELLALTRFKLNNLGFLVVDVPSGIQYYRVHCTPENQFRDGWVMGSGNIKTFYRNYYAQELDRLVSSSTSFHLYKKTWFDKHLVRIWQKHD